MTTLTIRRADLADEAAIFALLLRVGTESAYAGQRVSPSHLEQTTRQFLGSNEAGFLVADADGQIVGLLAILCYPHLLTGERRASELCWWMDPAERTGVGLDLLEAGEAWARDRGATTIEMLAPAEKFARYFERRGYERRATVYERSL